MFSKNLMKGKTGEAIAKVKLKNMGCAVWDVSVGEDGNSGSKLRGNRAIINSASITNRLTILNDRLRVEAPYFDFDFTTLYDMSRSPKSGVGVLENQESISFHLPDFFVSFCPHIADRFGPFGLVEVKTTKSINQKNYIISREHFDDYNMIGYASPIPTFIMYVFQDDLSKFAFQSVSMLDRYKSKFVVSWSSDKVYKLPRHAFDENIIF